MNVRRDDSHKSESNNILFKKLTLIFFFNEMIVNIFIKNTSAADQQCGSLKQ